ncbi:MAG: hypothetical protein LBU23_01290, partial [Planctomycetota bacterium]|nr:hypothetical protein [Planctomycetota bacterium]
EQERLVIGGVTQAIRRALSGLAGLPTFLSLAATAGKGGKTTGHSRAAVPGGGDLRNRAGPGGGEAESEEVRQHLFEDIDPGFAAKAANGGGVAGGENFGCGSAREQGLTALKYAGIGLVVCKSFSRAFYRNGINNAVALFIADCPEPMGEIAQAGDELEADFTGGTLRNLSRNREFACSPAPAFIAEVLRAGGIYEYYAANGFQAAKG